MTAAPPPAWYPDPDDTALLRWWDGTRWTPWEAPRPPAVWTGQHGTPPLPLDATVMALRASDRQPWGARPVLLPLLTYLVLIVSGGVVANTVAPQHGDGARVFDVVADVVLEAILGVAVYYAGRDVARRNGGWAAAFGLRRPRWRDLLVALAGIGIAFGARIVIGIIAGLATGGRALKQSENIHITSVNPLTATMLVLVVVIAAPFVEELVFRGMLLRTFMRRMPFWPAAALSTAIFAIGHTYEVSTLLGAVTLACMVGSLGLTNCVLNRYTDRLVPGMIVHATFNGVAVLVLLLGYSG